MADTQNNTIKTRVQLKYDSYTEWNKVATSFQPLKGEICIVNPATTLAEAGRTPCLIKIGDGSTKFDKLPWLSAIAADVYAWAKKETPDWADFPALPIEVIDNGTGKFITDITYAANKITIYRDDAVNTLTIGIDTDTNDPVVLVVDKNKGDVKLTGTHKKYNGEGFLNEDDQDIVTPGQEYTIRVPKLTVDEYGHTTYDGETTHTIQIPDEAVVNDGTLTLKAGSGLATVTPVVFSANSSQNKEITFSHANTSSVADLTKTDRTYISGITFDDFGHVLSVSTGKEADQDLSGYKVKQTPVSDPTADGNATAFIDSISQDANGNITVTKKSITAADLGLSKVMNFLGTTTTSLSDGSTTQTVKIDGKDVAVTKGDVVLSGDKEYVFDGSKWKELGDQGSHALKTITITGDDGLTGGGSLEQNRTIKHSVPTGASAGDKGSSNARTYLTKVTTDKFGHVTGFDTATETVSQGIVSITANGDSEVGLAFTDYEDNTALITAAHTAHAGGSAKTASTATIGNAYGATGTIKIPKIVTNDYGHVTEISEETVTIKMPAAQTIPTGSGTATIASISNDVVTLKASAKLNDHTLANGTGNDITLAKIAKTGNVADLVQTANTYIVFDCGSATEVI